MSEEFGNDSPMLNQDPARQQATLVSPVKKKGGRTKEKDLAHGIPQAVIDKFNLMTPEHKTAQQRKHRIQVI